VRTFYQYKKHHEKFFYTVPSFDIFLQGGAVGYSLNLKPSVVNADIKDGGRVPNTKKGQPTRAWDAVL
jgi:hypothetical protein